MDDFLFVLKDKGTANQGWWLKLQNTDDLCHYYEVSAPTRNGNIFENYMYGKEWNGYHPGIINNSHCPHMQEASITDAVVRYAADRSMNVLQALNGFTSMVALQQLEEIQSSGAIYVNPNGGYRGYYEGDKEYAFVRRKELVFPDFKKNDIRIKKFPYGNHYYAYIGDMQVKDGNIIKWNTYEEAHRVALAVLDVSCSL